MLNKKLLIAAVVTLSLLNNAHAYNIYLRTESTILPHVVVEVYYQAQAKNYNKIASHDSAQYFDTKDGKIGSWNWHNVKTPLGQKFGEHEKVKAKIIINSRELSDMIAFEVSGYLEVIPMTNNQAKVIGHRSDHSVTSESTYNY